MSMIKQTKMHMMGIDTSEGVKSLASALQLAGLVARYEPQDSDVLEIKEKAMANVEEVLDVLQECMVYNSVNIFNETDLECRQMMCHEVFLILAALELLEVEDDFWDLEATVDSSWSDLKGFAVHCHKIFPSPEGSKTDRFITAIKEVA